LEGEREAQGDLLFAGRKEGGFLLWYDLVLKLTGEYKMVAITFDTLRYANRLKAAGAESKIAEAEAEALAEIFELNLKEVATREDIKFLEESSEPALKRMVFFAAIWITAPVLGLRPLRAFLLEMSKDPKPTKEILSPFFNALVVAPTNPSNAFLASAFDNPAAAAIASINSALFIINWF
jgi:hypothetical protein